MDYLKLEIQATPYDFKTGKLSSNDSYWFSDMNINSNRWCINLIGNINDFNWSLVVITFFFFFYIFCRTEIDLNNCEVPILISEWHTLENTTNRFIHFTTTDFLSRDAGQTTIPLIDAQPIAPEPPAPFSNVGLDLKKTKSSGGFITPTVRTISKWLSGT